MAKAKAKAIDAIGPQAIVLPKMDIRHLTLTLVGDTPLIVHKWSEKAKRQMLEKQMKKASAGKAAKDPDQDFRDSLYVLNQAEVNKGAKPVYGFPTLGIKAAAVTAAKQAEMAMTDARMAFHINEEMAVIKGDEPVKREDMVTIHMTTDIRHRGEFRNWRTTVKVHYNARFITAEQIVNLFNLAGFGVGIGEWRPQKNGRNGKFHVLTSSELEQQ